MALPRDPEPVTEYVCEKCEREMNLRHVDRNPADATPVFDNGFFEGVHCSVHGKHNDYNTVEI